MNFPPDEDGLEALFHAAAGLQPSDREAFLRHECASDPARLGLLRDLLEVDRRSAAIWEDGALTFEARHTAAQIGAVEAGEFFGPYRVLEKIGSGGMGVVYAAVRADDEYRKKVAIKLLSGGLHTSDEILRFRRERQILADLEHPNIARLLDGGTTRAGVPYLVMEYVDGLPIHEYAARKELPEDERLRLFQILCDAVQYAHRNLVVHRDLKPSNVLVAANGAPKLLDFGIAKQLSAADSMHGRTGLMTPDYASPEQILGERITIASDIYSLGILLFLLLTGRHPFRNPDRPAQNIRHAMFESEPENHVRGNLKDDLGHIVCMALQRDPQLRYGSVEQFSADIRRYREGRPVTARRRTFLYRSSRYLRRNRLALALTVAIIAVGVYAAESKIAESRQAERRFNEVRKLANSLAFEIPDAIASIPGTLAARQLIVKHATTYFDGLAREAEGDRSLQSDLAAAYNRLGTLTFGVANSLELHRKALEISRALTASEPDNRKYRAQLSSSYALVADILREEGDVTGATDNYRNSLAEAQNLAQLAPDNAEYQAALADSYEQMGIVSALAGKSRESLEFHYQTLPIRERLQSLHPDDLKYRRALMTDYSFIAQGLMNRGDYAAALQYQGQASSIARQLFATDPSNTAHRRDLWVVGVRQARLLSETGNISAALPEYRKALALIQSLAAADPGDRGHQHGVAITYLAIADTLAALGRSSMAIATYNQAIAVSDTLLAADPKKVETSIDLARMNSRLGKLYVRDRDHRKASACFARAQTLFENIFALDPGNTAVQAEAREVTQWIAKSATAAVRSK